MLSRWTARVAVDNGWTYLYITDARHLAHAMKIASLYAPAVIFLEDIDKAMEGERSVEMNDILNTFDGIDTKDKAIITIMTTNKLDKINKAFLRAGRIDSLIHMGPIDSTNSIEFINRFVVDRSGVSLLNKKEDYTEAGKALEGIVPAFVDGIIQNAKMYALSREGDDSGTVMPDDLIVAAETYRSHIALTEDKKQETPESGLAEAIFNVARHFGEYAEQKGSEVSIQI